MVGMMCRSLMIALFNERMSTQILISFGLFGLGTTTIGDTQGVGPSTRSMMSSFSSCLSFSSTCFLTWKGTRRCGCATGLTDSSTCMRAGSPLYLPIPLVRLGNSLRKSGASGGRLPGGSTVLTALIRFNVCEVVQLSMELDEPFAT